MIFDKYSLNITSYPTITSLTLAIFLCHYLPKGTVPMISGQIAKDIRESYTGGATDMYIPYSDNVNKPLYCYDVNSLYPFVMSDNKLPCGKITYQHKQEGDIFKVLPQAADVKGFFYCKVTAPDNLDHPIIQLHVKNNNKINTMSPLGTFELMIYQHNCF
jgi:DNA polymerase type B, organellar and viral